MIRKNDTVLASSLKKARHCDKSQEKGSENASAGTVHVSSVISICQYLAMIKH
jgi:hypothetical protein